MYFGSYQELVISSKLADYGPVHGSIIIRPYGMKIWNLMMQHLSAEINSHGYEQVYFPMFFPCSFLDDEKKYIPGLDPTYFSALLPPEALSTEQWAIRPTSETIACYMFSQWVHSYRDLPLKVYQWSNIARWAPVTKPFIKGTEIQWIEGHSVHATHQEALEDISEVVTIFEKFLTQILRIPVSFGLESQSTKFKGSLNTITFEAMMPSGRSLQVGAVYDLGTIFTQQFQVTYHSEKNQRELSWMTDWGMGFRLIGAVLLVHSDNRGLCLPPQIAPYQVVLLQLRSKNGGQNRIISFSNSLSCSLEKNNIRVKTEIIDSNSLRRKLQKFEKQGIPVIIPIGDQEVDTGMLCLHCRDLPISDNIQHCHSDLLNQTVLKIFDRISETLMERAISYKRQHTKEASNVSEFDEEINDNWVAAAWCGDLACEEQICNNYGHLIRYIDSDKDFLSSHAKCIFCKKKSVYKTFFSKKY